MNKVAREIYDVLAHSGVGHDDNPPGRGSGRYGYGTGANPYQHPTDIATRVRQLQKEGLSLEEIRQTLHLSTQYDTPGDLAAQIKELGKGNFKEKEIAELLGFPSTTALRKANVLDKHARDDARDALIFKYAEEGYTPTEIGRMMGKNESTIRSILTGTAKANRDKAKVVAELLKKELEEKGVLDVGEGVEREISGLLGTKISKDKLEEALILLEKEGYNVHNGFGIPNITDPYDKKKYMTTLVSTGDIDRQHIYKHYDEIMPVGEYASEDGGVTWRKREYPASIDSSRIDICYGDKGGSAKDGVIEIRKGVEDLNLGDSHYAQVRILVDGTHYLKGMAMYSNDLPPGVDIRFNTNKPEGKEKLEYLKPINKEDPTNPFGAYIKADGQSKYIGKDGKEHLSAINKLREESEWDDMSKNLSSQFLSKQPAPLIKQQLALTYEDYNRQYEAIRDLNNPTVKRKLLADFADNCDSAAIHLKAINFPRQSTKVLLPITTLKENEIYAPTYHNGEKVVLIRYPHGGTFEIPELIVNNKNKGAIDILGKDIKDAVGINVKTAQKLSGADFDGDTTIVIPVGSKLKIQTKPTFKELENFDPKQYQGIKTEHGYFNETTGKYYKPMEKKNKQREMGIVSNLITDMTLKGAPDDQIIRAVKHSMVVIDAEKHKLDYKQSYIDNDIKGLVNTWQKKTDAHGNVKYGGASTLLSRRKHDVEVDERKSSKLINLKGKEWYDPSKPEGAYIYQNTNATHPNKKGEVVKNKSKVSLILETDDARKLSSGTVQENLYADYINKMKALANTARKEEAVTGRLKYQPTAAKTYEKEVASLNAKLNRAKLNAPKERRAQAIANSRINAMLQEHPELKEQDSETKKQLKKKKQIAIEDARAEVSAAQKYNEGDEKNKGTRFKFSDSEWEAIQMGAISDSKLSTLLKYADPDDVRQRATPRTTKEVSSAKKAKIEAMLASGSYTIAQIAQACGVSVSTVNNIGKE